MNGNRKGGVAPADISVIVLAAGEPELTRRCLASITSATTSPGEVIVVGEVADPKTAAVVGEARGVRFILLPFPVGPASARNAAALSAGGSVLFFVDGAVELLPDAIDRLCETFNARPRTGAVAPSGSATGLVAQYRGLLHRFTCPTEAADALTFSADCGAIRANVFRALGGFEPGQPLSDVELGCRLRRGGHRIAMGPPLLIERATAREGVSASSMSRLKQFMQSIRLALAHSKARGIEPARGWSDDLSTLFAILTPLLLVTALSWPPAASVALVTAALWWRINKSFLQFLDERRGHRFALAAVPLHWLHSIAPGFNAVRSLFD